ncbi:hypothetical protein FACS1894123_02900 [Bacteroidia bacterium]|nr:hypothetical protein FACS1894123_02900 [Bacteroidia bacterium]
MYVFAHLQKIGISLARGSAAATATFANGVIIAAPHASTPLKRIEVLYLGNLKAYVQNGTLHVGGLTAGKQWAVYNLSGALVYNGIAGNDEADVSLSVRGVYIVKSGNKTVKVMY